MSVETVAFDIWRRASGVDLALNLAAFDNRLRAEIDKLEPAALRNSVAEIIGERIDAMHQLSRGRRGGGGGDQAADVALATWNRVFRDRDAAAPLGVIDADLRREALKIADPELRAAVVKANAKRLAGLAQHSAPAGLLDWHARIPDTVGPLRLTSADRADPECLAIIKRMERAVSGVVDCQREITSWLSTITDCLQVTHDRLQRIEAAVGPNGIDDRPGDVPFGGDVQIGGRHG